MRGFSFASAITASTLSFSSYAMAQSSAHPLYSPHTLRVIDYTYEMAISTISPYNSCRVTQLSNFSHIRTSNVRPRAIHAARDTTWLLQSKGVM